MKHWSRNKFCYYPAGSRFAFETKFINKKLSNEFGFKVYLGLSRCMKGGHTHNHFYNVCSRHLRPSKDRRKRMFKDFLDKKTCIDVFNKVVQNHK